jgi:hypothetical protein
VCLETAECSGNVSRKYRSYYPETVQANVLGEYSCTDGPQNSEKKYSGAVAGLAEVDIGLRSWCEAELERYYGW